MRHPLSGLRTTVISGLAAAVFLPLQAFAVSITYDVTNLAGNQWRYDYTVANDGSLPLSADIEGIQIFFDPASYENLAVAASPATWDLLVFPPDTGLPLDGVLDGYALPGPGIAAGNSLGGFSVLFDWLGAEVPGPGDQSFVIYQDLGPSCDPEATDCFPVLASGMTVATSVVPLPAAVWLLGTSLSALGFVKRRRNLAVAGDTTL